MSAAPPATARRLWARVSGHVQGVGYRATTVDVARRLDLAGWVRNLVDGAVELEAEGKPEALDQLVVFLHRGPQGARVDGVQLDWGDVDAASPLPRPFEVRRTV